MSKEPQEITDEDKIYDEFDVKNVHNDKMKSKVAKAISNKEHDLGMLFLFF